MDSNPAFASTGGVTIRIASTLARDLSSCRSCVKMVATTLFCLCISYSYIPMSLGREKKHLNTSRFSRRVPKASSVAYDLQTGGVIVQVGKDSGRGGSLSVSDIASSLGDVRNIMGVAVEEEDASDTLLYPYLNNNDQSKSFSKYMENSNKKTRRRPNVAFAKRTDMKTLRVAGRQHSERRSIEGNFERVGTSINERIYSLFAQRDTSSYLSKFSKNPDLHGAILGITTALSFSILVFVVGFTYSSIRQRRRGRGLYHAILI